MVVLWDVSTGQAVRRYRGHASRVSCVKFNEESSVVISGSHDNSVMIWDTRSRNYDAMQVNTRYSICIIYKKKGYR
jgi:mitogen-activated protein kinase organizer 1